MHPFHRVILAVGLPLLLATGVMLVVFEHGLNGELRAWVPLVRAAFAVLAIGVPAVTAVGTILLARRAGRRNGRSQADLVPAEIRAQLESLRRNPPPPPPPLSPAEREHLVATDPEALTEQQRDRYLLAPMDGLTAKEKRAMRAAVTSGDTYREIGSLMRQRRVPSTPPNPTVVALRPLGFLLLALIVTVLPVAAIAVNAIIVLYAAGIVGTREDIAFGWGTLLLAPVFGWFLTLFPPSAVALALNVWTCFVRSLQPRFSQSHIAFTDRRSVTPIHRTRVTAVWRFLELVAWLPTWPLVLGTIANGFALIAYLFGWTLPAGILLAIGLVLVVVGVRERWRRWKPTYDQLPDAAEKPQRR